MAAMPPEVAVPESEVRAQTRTLPPWKVILHNDEVTTFDFVVWLMVTLFRKELPEAVRLTSEVHETGQALVTVTSRERAELYVEQVRSIARARGYPLTASTEPE
jgi:ATP-dependent Clp protease adaptor protein ClpS